MSKTTATKKTAAKTTAKKTAVVAASTRSVSAKTSSPSSSKKVSGGAKTSKTASTKKVADSLTAKAAVKKQQPSPKQTDKQGASKSSTPASVKQTSRTRKSSPVEPVVPVKKTSTVMPKDTLINAPKASASRGAVASSAAPTVKAKPAARTPADDIPGERMTPTRKIDPKLASVWKTKAGKDMTDEEILAMPDSEYMSEQQLEFFKVKLEALKDDLLSNAGETTEHLREDTTIVPDPADRATIEEEHALELRTRDRERKLLKKITQAISRIDTGEYGFCDETGEPIGLGRLIARPTATLTLEAQQRRELKQKMYGD